MWELMVQVAHETLKYWIPEKEKSKKKGAQLDEHIA
jgi:hypothetical protein